MGSYAQLQMSSARLSEWVNWPSIRTRLQAAGVGEALIYEISTLPQVGNDFPFYAVHLGHCPGVVSSYNEARAFVHGFPGNYQCGALSLLEAQAIVQYGPEARTIA